MSNQFDISLDTLLKVNSKMVQSMDKERAMGIIKHEKSKSDKKSISVYWTTEKYWYELSRFTVYDKSRGFI